jgi:hypothetical protein
MNQLQNILKVINQLLIILINFKGFKTLKLKKTFKSFFNNKIGIDSI